MGRALIRHWKKFLLVVPLHFLALKAHLIVFGERFRDGQSVWPVSCLLFFYSRCPRAQPFVKVGGGGHVPPCPMKWAPLQTSSFAAEPQLTVDRFHILL